MGIAQHPCQGICLPTSFSDNTHGVFFPTGANEQCFQFHFDVPTKQADPSNWGTLSQAVTERECAALVQRLRNEGWSEEKYLEPFRHVVSALRIGLCLLEPALERFVHWDNTVVLLGDAAHPPVPYLGQAGAMGMEDATVLSLLLRHYCCSDGRSTGLVDPQNLSMVLQLYEQMRVPRTRAMLENSRQMGRAQTLRASPVGNRRAAREEMIQRQVFFHETLPLLFPGANYDVRREVEAVIAKARLPIVVEEEGEDEEGGRSHDDHHGQSRTENPVLWVSCAEGITGADTAPTVQNRERAFLATDCN
jgi:salicylate hydroxylase